jgi:hypothetical protein
VKKGKTGVMPDLSGTPGTICSVEGLNLAFGASKRVSPYDKLLDELAASTTPNQALCFESTKARTSVAIRAKKKGLRVSFAEHAGRLYVRFDGRAENAGVLIPAPAPSSLKAVFTGRRAAILDALRVGSRNAARLVAALQASGDSGVDMNLIETLCAQMVREGVIEVQGGMYRITEKGAA